MKNPSRRACSKQLRVFGNDLHRWINSEKGGLLILPPGYETWEVGGCWILAQALQKWVGPESKKYGVAGGGRTWHVVVRVGDCYLDGSGASTEKELLSHWKHMGIGPDAHLRPFRVKEAGNIECPATAARDLERALHRTFGDGNQVLEWAEG